tara:strand:- start:499 stop:1134 length:636 start_codon:yes stop_codon:yes gene_type:complete
MGLVSFFNIQQMKSISSAEIFVETGTYKGEGVEFASNFGFEKIFSIEIFDKLAEKAKEKFKDRQNIEIIHSDSSSGLRSIMDRLDKNCIFWLDAHFPGSDVGATSYDQEKEHDINMPLLKELKILSERKSFNDIILVDDLRTFKEVPDKFKHLVNGFNEHMESIGQSHVKKENLVNFDLEKEILSLFPDKNAVEFWVDSGYLAILPKGVQK